MTATLQDLTHLDPADTARYGGKATGLARLAAAGARVPAGFALPASSLPVERWPEDARAALRQQAGALLERGRVAVRSSAVGEDSAERSFAGLFETFLGVDCAQGVLEAVDNCIASAAAPRVLAYAGSAPPVGVVVQVQIEARCAGVCFTVDPAGRDGAVVIEAVPGTGDALVSGRAQPDRWRVYRSGLGGWEARLEAREAAGPVLEAALATQVAREALELAGRMGHPLDLEWAVDEAGILWWLQARPVTAATQWAGYAIDRANPTPDEGPVTVWSNFNVRETMPDALTPLSWSMWRDIVLPFVTAQVTGVSFRSPMLPHLLGIDRVNGRIYFNLNGALGMPFTGPMVKRMFALVDRQLGQVMDQLTADGVLQPRRTPGSKLRQLFTVIGASITSSMRLTVALRPARALAEMERVGREVRLRPALKTMSDEALLEELRLLTDDATEPLHTGILILIPTVTMWELGRRAFRHHPDAQQRLASGLICPTTGISIGIERLTAAAAPLAELFREPLPWLELKARLEASPEGRAWWVSLEAFLAEYGHRAPGEFDFGLPRWAEDPTMILDLVRAGLATPPKEAVSARLARLYEERKAAIDAAVAASPWWRRGFLRWCAGMVERFMPLREAPKHNAMFVYQRMRGAALELGVRLADRGLIPAEEDVLYLEQAEVASLIRGKGLPGGSVAPLHAAADAAAARAAHPPQVTTADSSKAMTDPTRDRAMDSESRVTTGSPAAGAAVALTRLLERRRTQHAYFRANPAPDFVRSDGVPVVEEDPQLAHEPGLLRGVGVTPAWAAGPVRVLLEPDPRLITDGDVLVMRFADPGWTPLFPRASAVVMEVGGLMCHAAIVARELGIPAVFGVKEATRLLQDGQRVTVDGTSGTVRFEAG